NANQMFLRQTPAPLGHWTLDIGHWILDIGYSSAHLHDIERVFEENQERPKRVELFSQSPV
ncbi:MAG TPA: hypothetical protein VK168_08025, partial [Saprospiraceae bacterium]|nr:hypothetical protein [Saprospiraceae bacterium]